MLSIGQKKYDQSFWSDWWWRFGIGKERFNDSNQVNPLKSYYDFAILILYDSLLIF